MNENNNEVMEEQGVTFKDICKTIGKGWLPGVIAAVVVAVVAVIFIFCIYNPSQQVYQVEFDYSSIPGIGDGGGYYLDGTRFSYKDIIVSDNVNIVLEKNAEEVKAGTAKYDYSTIDLNKLYSSTFTIDINRVYYDKLTDADNEIPELKETHYLITMPPKAFTEKAQARAFAQDLIEQPLYNTIEMMKNLDYTTNLTMYSQALSYEDKLGYLSSQISLIQNGYASFNSSVGGTVYTIGGKTYNFETIQAEFNNFFATLNYSSMSTEIRQLGYYNPTTENTALYKARLSYEKEDLDKSYELLVQKLQVIDDTYDEVTKSLKEITTKDYTTDQIIAMLTEIGSSYSSSVNSLKTQMLENRESLRVLMIKINAVNNQKSVTDADGNITYVDKTQAEIDEFNTNNAAFGARLDSIYNRLVTETETYDLVYKYISTRNMNIYYTRADVIGVDGGLKTMYAVLIPVAGAVVVFLIVAGICGAVKKNKEAKVSKKEDEITA